MHSLDDIKWRNASYDGYLEFRVKVSRGPRKPVDHTTEETERLAAGMRDALEARGFTVRIEHVRFMDG